MKHRGVGLCSIHPQVDPHRHCRRCGEAIWSEDDAHQCAPGFLTRLIGSKSLRPKRKPKLREAFEVVICIRQFRYDPKVGSYKRELLPGKVVSEHSDWSLGDYDTLEEADRAVAHMVRDDRNMSAALPAELAPREGGRLF